MEDRKVLLEIANIIDAAVLLVNDNLRLRLAKAALKSAGLPEQTEFCEFVASCEAISLLEDLQLFTYRIRQETAGSPTEILSRLASQSIWTVAGCSDGSPALLATALQQGLTGTAKSSQASYDVAVHVRRIFTDEIIRPIDEAIRRFFLAHIGA